jgi:hypothetical protein
MLLYSVYENGASRKVKKADFKENKVYVIDESKNIYIWIGSKATKKKKEYAIKKANDIKKKRDKSTNIQIISQNEEFGTFLAIMDDLRRGIEQKASLEIRPELELDIEDTMELIEAGLEPDLIAEINLDAYNISEENKPYKDLCRELAKLQMIILKGKNKILEKDIQKKSEEIFKSSSTYEEICWLIAQLRKLLEKDLIKKK